MINIIIIISTIITILLAVAYATLAERKIMGSMQRRLGPNIVGIYGLLQPLADGGKLYLKENVLPSHSNHVLFIGAPLATLTLSLLGWIIIPFHVNVVLIDSPISLLIILAISALGIYGVILSGWAANSKYALLGTLRSTAQMISYEVVFGLITIIIIICIGEPNIWMIALSQQAQWLIIPLAPLGLLFIISALAETNRAPFDLPEAESELVAGYFTEHSAIPFAYFFLGEYSNILLISTLTVLFFFGGWFLPSFINDILAYPLVSTDTVLNIQGPLTDSIAQTDVVPQGLAGEDGKTLITSLSAYHTQGGERHGLLAWNIWPAGAYPGQSMILGMKVTIIYFIIIWVRATFPRWKYSQLILICWTSILPITLGSVILVPSLLLLLLGCVA